MTRLIIGFAGLAGSGKSTASRLLVHHGKPWFTPVAFADPLKDMLRALRVPEDALTGSQRDKGAPRRLLAGKSARYALQTLGTEWGRNLMGESFWAIQWLRRVERMEQINVVADDVRFQSEVDAIHAIGGCIYRISRPGLEVDPNGHASERPDLLVNVDHDIVNDGTETELLAKLQRLIEQRREAA